jgi:putative PIN family toxin of toxin-antitoxin system
MSKKNNSFRVFVDSNVLISAIRSNQSISSKLLNLVLEEHHLIICTYTLTEVSRVINKRFPNMIATWDRMLSSLEFELSYTPSDVSTYKVPYIRDEKDIPILVSAIIAQPDILVTADFDFHTSEIQEYFAVYTPSDFLKYFDHKQ